METKIPTETEIEEEFQNYLSALPPVRSERETKESKGSRAEDKIKKLKNEWLYKRYGNSLRQLMFNDPELLAQELFSSGNAMKVFVLGITYPLYNSNFLPEGYISKKTIEAIENLAEELSDLSTGDSYERSTTEEKLRIVNDRKTISGLKELFEEMLKKK